MKDTCRKPTRRMTIPYRQNHQRSAEIHHIRRFLICTRLKKNVHHKGHVVAGARAAALVQQQLLDLLQRRGFAGQAPLLQDVRDHIWRGWFVCFRSDGQLLLDETAYISYVEAFVSDCCVSTV